MMRIGIGASSLIAANLALAPLLFHVPSAEPEALSPIPAARAVSSTPLPTFRQMRPVSDPSLARLFAPLVVTEKSPTLSGLSQPEDKTFRLIGVILPEGVDAAATPVAVLEVGTPRKVVRLRPGDTFDDLGLRLVVVERKRVQFEGPDGRLIKPMD